jgi:hypothetical protein
MNEYFIHELINEDSFSVSPATRQVLQDLGMSTLISIYCEAGRKFDSKNFKDQFKELIGAGPSNAATLIDVHKVYNFLNGIRMKLCEENKKQKVTSTPSSTSSSISSRSTPGVIHINSLLQQTTSDSEIEEDK